MVATTAISYRCAAAEIYMAGDSTMCNYNPQKQYPQQGWGQALYRFMKDPAKLHNKAIGGRSAKSFKEEGRWQGIVDELKRGDFVIVAFGHNDANKAKPERYSTKEDYKALMKGFADDVKAKGATIIYATSIPHSGGVTKDDAGVTHVRGTAAGIGPYMDATRELGKELGIEVLDLNAYACEKFAELGQDAVFKLYMRIALASTSASRTETGTDATRATRARTSLRARRSRCAASGSSPSPRSSRTLRTFH
jgi:lysophospholipase L1-like esterase